ncbi:IS66 family transposase [Wolbachia endosymbiont (group B) of Longitarsus flavicornis]|uniref:IS66 family transposase n=1 Tax=Wolbachia endosymbiont (group B) of Longitarsus flavicornis TaxID=3066135 RepID=UPI003341ACD1
MISIVELCKNLEQKVAKLEEKNKILEIENAELRERLGLNSRNSSLPSSKELYKIKKDTPEDKSEGGRKIGGQVGHKGNYRIKMEADEVIRVRLHDTCECGGEIAVCNKPYIHQNVDLPKIKPYVVEYQLEHGRCRKCGKRRSSKLPEGVTPDTFGPRVKSVVASLSGFYKNSKREIANIMKDIFNMSISVGSVSNSEARVSSKCKEAYEQIEEEMKASEILHIDETSHYNKGKLEWCWMFANNKASLMKLADTRGMKFLKNSAFCDYKNRVITDRYGVYNHFSDEKRQICWAHLLRNFERLSHSWNSEVMRLGHCLKDAANGLFTLKNALSENEISISKFTKQAKELRRFMQYCMIKISYILEAKGASRTVKGIIKSEPMMWTFLDDPENIPLTNNHVERQIRHYVVYRKNSYFAQSERGNRFLERIISLYLTWRQKKLNPFQNLLSIVS